jgi:phage gpG-like protein
MLEITIDKQASRALLDLMANHKEKFDAAMGLALDATANRGRQYVHGYAPYKTGNLRRSITIQRGAENLERIIGTNLIYAPIHEYGGTVKAKSRRFLVFKVNGQWVSVKKVTIPKYKGRGYFAPSMTDLQKVAPSFFERAIEKIIT